MGANRRRWNRKWVWDTNISLYLCHPCTNFKCLSVICIINMLSIIVHYYFCVQATHKPVITWYLWEQEFLHRLHYKMMSENLDIFHKCPNRLNLLQGVNNWLSLQDIYCKKLWSRLFCSKHAMHPAGTSEISDWNGDITNFWHNLQLLPVHHFDISVGVCGMYSLCF